MGCGASARVDDKYNGSFAEYSDSESEWKVKTSSATACKSYEDDGSLPPGSGEDGLELRALLDNTDAAVYLKIFFASKRLETVYNCWESIRVHRKNLDPTTKPVTLKVVYDTYLILKKLENISNCFIHQLFSIVMLNDQVIQDISDVCFTLLCYNFVEFKNTNAYRQMSTMLIKKYNCVKASDFEYLDCLGKGGFGMVVRCRKLSTNKYYAMKIQPKRDLFDAYRRNPSRVDHEKQTLIYCKHPFITELFYAFQTQTMVMLVMNVCTNGDLSQHLRLDLVFSVERTIFYAAEITSALTYLHAKGFIYRDLKPANILLNRDGHIQLTDMGAVIGEYGSVLRTNKCSLGSLGVLSPYDTGSDYCTQNNTKRSPMPSVKGHHEMFNFSTLPSEEKVVADQYYENWKSNQVCPSFHVGEEKSISHMTAQSVVGTRGYMAPEMFVMQCQMKRGHHVTERYSSIVDWWSLGVTLYRFLTGLNPFAKADFGDALYIDNMALQKLVVLEMYRQILARVDYTTFHEHLALVDFLKSLLQIDCTTRLNSVQVKLHPVFQHISWTLLDKKGISPPSFRCIVRESGKGNEVRSFDRLLETEHKMDWISLEDNPISVYQEYFDFWNYASMDAIVEESVYKRYSVK